MKGTLIELAGNIPAIVKNTHLTVNLQGWPAAVAVIALCTGSVVVYAIKASTASTNEVGISGVSGQKVAA